MEESEHVGIQSAIDLREAQDQKLSYRGRDEPSITTSDEEKEVYDPTSLLVIEDAPLRYDVDIVTKLIVYAGKDPHSLLCVCLILTAFLIGIGFVAVFVAPLLFNVMSQLF